MKPAQLVIYNGNVYYVKRVYTSLATITTLTNYHNICAQRYWARVFTMFDS